MTNINSAYINALLADATYALDTNDLEGKKAKDLADLLEKRMTPTLAQYIGDNFTVVTHIETPDGFGTGFDATVWKNTTGKLTVSMQGTQAQQFAQRYTSVLAVGRPPTARSTRWALH